MSLVSSNGNGTPSRLPHPAKSRWQPLRSGFVDIYKYDREEFHYENGRLLLRGNNGTGKSRVLALQLPFLLEGDTSPHRVEPDADPAKRIEWNLLMGKYPERTGYTWIEFGRRTPDGGDHYLSLGCGMTAVEGRSSVQRWFFVTDQRVGDGLRLENEFNQVLTRERLQEAIGSRGQVFTTAQSYRQAVNQHLFRLEEYRFATLMNLLVRLRRPQLTRQFDENELSDILSEALPPVSPSILADVSDAFRSLEADRTQLDSFISANQAVATFLKDYLRYIQAAALRRADHVRDRQAAYENRQRQIRAEQANEEKTRAQIEETAAEILRLESDARAVEMEIETLRASPHMKDADDLDRAAKDVERLRGEKQSADILRDQFARSRIDAEGRLRSATEALEQSQREVTAAASKVEDAARTAQVLPAFQTAIGPLAVPHLPDAGAVAPAKRGVENVAAQQTRRIDTLRALNAIADKAEQLFISASREETGIRGQLDRAMETHRGFHDGLRSAIVFIASAYRAWVGTLTELHVGDVESAIEALTLWCETSDGPNPAEHAVALAYRDAVKAIADDRARTDQQLKMSVDALDELHSEHARLQEGRHAPPPAPYTRGADVRVDRPGAPLWLVCDFNDSLDSAARAGFEAALESAGLLDAWIAPDGKLYDRDVHDAILTVGDSPLPSDDAHLGLFLNPSIDPDDLRAASVPAGVVRDVLRHIGTGPESGMVWVAPSGQWQVGPLRGAWIKDEAAHIGQGAREIWRKRRMDEIAAEMNAVQGAIDLLKARLDTLRDRDDAARREVDSVPSDERIRALHAEIASILRTIDDVRGQLVDAEHRTADCRRERYAAAERRDETARDLGLAEWIRRLDEIEKALSGYLLSAEALFGGIHLLLARREQGAHAQTELESAKERERQQNTRARECDLALTAAVAQFDTLKKTVGAAVEQITRELAEARRGRDAVKKQENTASENRSRAEAELARILGVLGLHVQELESETRSREESVQQFKAFAETRLLHLAVPAVNDEAAASWSVTRSVETARETISVLASADASDAAWERLQKGVAQQYYDLLQHLRSHECRASGSWCGDVFVAAVSYGPEERSIEQLRDWLAGEVATRQELLAAREREMLENHLIGDVADHLNDLLHRGEALRDDMNAELDSRPTSTGMKLRFTWRVREDEPGIAEARKLLLRMSGAWTPAERQVVGGFLQARIQAERSAAEAASWQESLALALDYRKWHMFGVERYQDGKWKLLTRRTHGTGSGGEKAIALTLPQFAAAAAYYRSADPMAPRLILLDEAFVGIDTDMRGKCMGLIETFDLDFLMTSEREWACYASLPGVAIYQLSTRPGVEAVGLTRWVWNGREKVFDGHGS